MDLEPPPLRQLPFDWKRGALVSGFVALVFGMMLTTWLMTGEVRLSTNRFQKPIVRKQDHPRMFWKVWNTVLGGGVLCSATAFVVAGRRLG